MTSIEGGAVRTKRRRWLACGAAALALAAAFAAAFGARAWCARRAEERTAAARKAFLARFGIASDGREAFVALPPQLPHALGPARLGADLFCDRRLGQTARRTCAACHRLNEGGVDGERHGGVLTRTAMNAAFAPVFLHDGSLTNSRDLVSQMLVRRDFVGAKDVQAVVRRLGADAALCARFRAVYAEGLTAATLVDALVQHGRTLLSPRTAFDRYWDGDRAALGAQEKAGMEVFRRQGCLACHDGPALGGLRVSKGRKVPSLRGIGARRVYLTDGSRNDLGAVLALMPGGDVDEAARAALVSFLKSL